MSPIYLSKRDMILRLGLGEPEFERMDRLAVFKDCKHLTAGGRWVYHVVDTITAANERVKAERNAMQSVVKRPLGLRL